MDKMKKGFRIFTLMILVLSLSLAFGCTANEDTAKTEEEVIVAGYVLDKITEGENSYITFHIPITPEGQASDLKLKVVNKEDYDNLVENNYYLISYGKDSLEIKNIQPNNPLGEVISRGIGEGEGAVENEPIFPSNKLAIEDYTILDSYDYDIDGDGEEETIALYTTAQRDSNGEIMWDDGQVWLLAVHDSDKDYELYNNYLQLGSLQFYVFTSADSFHITTVENTTAGLKLVDYIFNKEDNSFTPKIHYNILGDVNMLHISKGY